MQALTTILLYFAFVTICGFILMGIDKRKAQKGAFRIPELSLFIIAFIGGSLGMLIGMYFFHHKTRKPLFKYGIPLLLLLQVLWFVYLLLQPIPIRFL